MLKIDADDCLQEAMRFPRCQDLYIKLLMYFNLSIGKIAVNTVSWCLLLWDNDV